jgi:hypothetical protein
VKQKTHSNVHAVFKQPICIETGIQHSKENCRGFITHGGQKQLITVAEWLSFINRISQNQGQAKILE